MDELFISYIINFESLLFQIITFMSYKGIVLVWAACGLWQLLIEEYNYHIGLYFDGCQYYNRENSYVTRMTSLDKPDRDTSSSKQSMSDNDSINEEEEWTSTCNGSSAYSVQNSSAQKYFDQHWSTRSLDRVGALLRGNRSTLSLHMRTNEKLLKDLFLDFILH